MCVCFQVCLAPGVILNAPLNLCPDELTLTEGHDLQTVNFSLHCQTSPAPLAPRFPLFLRREVRETWPSMERSSA